MQFKTNIPELIEKLERFKAAVINGGPPGSSGPETPAGSPGNISDALFSALNAGMGKMKFRIFNKGLDADGIPLGNYHGNKTKLTKGFLSKSLDDEFDEKERKKRKRVVNKTRKSNPDSTYTEYEKYRVSLGRQIDYKDLEVTGSLHASIRPAKTNNNKVVIVIENEQLGKIARYQERQIGNIRAGQNAKTGTASPAKIFSFSKDEYNHTKAEGNAAISQAIKKLFDEA